MTLFSKIFRRKPSGVKERAAAQFHTLETMLLGDFQDMWLGDTQRVLRGGVARADDIERAAEDLVLQYTGIVGGTGAAAELMRRDRVLRLRMRVTALDAALSLCAAGDAAGTRKVLEALGQRCGKNDTLETLKRRVKGLRARDAMRLKLYEKERITEKEEKIDRAYFTRERVAVMRATKLHIDPRTYTAAEYAYLVQSVTREYEQAKALNDKKPQKR